MSIRQATPDDTAMSDAVLTPVSISHWGMVEVDTLLWLSHPTFVNCVFESDMRCGFIISRVMYDNGQPSRVIIPPNEFYRGRD